MSDTLVPRTMEAARRTGYGKVAVAGVAANSRIRADLERACRASGHRLYLPALSLCGDNGAMIGCQAYYGYQAGRRGSSPQRLCHSLHRAGLIMHRPGNLGFRAVHFDRGRQRDAKLCYVYYDSKAAKSGDFG